MIIAVEGSLQGSDIYRAMVRNRAKLAYNSLSDWLEGRGPMPPVIGKVKGLDENLRLQDRVAQKLKLGMCTARLILRPSKRVRYSTAMRSRT